MGARLTACGVAFRVYPPPMDILLATGNPHKVSEIRAILAPLGITVRSLDDLGRNDLIEPDETGATFIANARIKAIGYAQQTGMNCLADDSGLEVDALDGRPGVFSARYAGIGSTREERDRANNAKLLDALKDVPIEQRTARFVCAMCLATPEGEILAESIGHFPGLIGHPPDIPRGTNGFGYDPLLILPGVGKTSAELPPEEKNARSHRGAAARMMAEQLRAMARI